MLVACPDCQSTKTIENGWKFPHTTEIACECGSRFAMGEGAELAKRLQQQSALAALDEPIAPMPERPSQPQMRENDTNVELGFGEVKCKFCRAPVAADAVKCPRCQEWLIEGNHAAGKSRGIAVLLSVVVPGAGQLYINRIGSGLMYLFLFFSTLAASLAFGPAVLLSFLFYLLNIFDVACLRKIGA